MTAGNTTSRTSCSSPRSSRRTSSVGLVRRLQQEEALVEQSVEESVPGGGSARPRMRSAALRDVVAHSMSAMVVQTAAAQDLVRSDPEKAEEVLRDIADTGRRPWSTVGCCTSSATMPTRQLGLAPTPGMADLEDLVSQSREGGLDVDLQVDREAPACRQASTSRRTALPRRRSRTHCDTATAPHRCASHHWGPASPSAPRTPVRTATACAARDSACAASPNGSPSSAER